MADSIKDLACPAVSVHDRFNDDIECTCGNIGSRLVCILGYNGSIKHVLINYSLILVNLVYCILEMKRVGTDVELRASRGKRHQEIRALSALAFVVLFQIILCLARRCSGVSIIWCAICGWIMSRHRRKIGDSEIVQEQQNVNLQEYSFAMEFGEKIVVLVDILAILFYAVAFPFITTVAHVCALVLGAILFSISDSEYDKLTREDPTTGQQTEALLSATPNNSSGAIDVANQQS
jgi:hypothetical protein